LTSRFLRLVTAAAIVTPLAYATLLTLGTHAVAAPGHSARSSVSHAAPSSAQKTVLADDWTGPVQ